MPSVATGIGQQGRSPAGVIWVPGDYLIDQWKERIGALDESVSSPSKAGSHQVGEPLPIQAMHQGLPNPEVGQRGLPVWYLSILKVRALNLDAPGTDVAGPI